VRAKLGSIYRRRKRQTDGTVSTLPVWWIKYYRNGRALRESSHSEDYAEAQRLLKKRQGEIVTGKFVGLGVERICVSKLFDDVVQDYELNRRKSSAQLLSRLRNHLRPAFGTIKAAELSTGHIRRYVAERLKKGATNATI